VSRSMRARRDVRDGLWEKVFVVVGCVVAVSLAFAGARKEFSHHSPNAAGASVQSVQAVQTTEQLSSDVAGVAATPVRKVRQRAQARVKAPAAPTPVDRTDCSEMRTTHLRTRAERQWFIDNCLYLSRKKPQPAQEWTAQLQAAGFSLAQPTPRRSASEAESTPPPSLTRQVAMSKATDWISNDSPMILTVEPPGCTAIWLNGHWVVSCSVRLAGCTGPTCVASLSLCVFASDPVILPDRLC
jgi:hypothetical protein